MSKVALTYRDYAALADDGRRYEIHDGDLSVTPSPSPVHQSVALRLGSCLLEHVERHRLGHVYMAPLDVILSDSTVVQPDVIYVGTERSSRIGERGIQGSPTLVIEILSPSTLSIDRVRKRDLYAGHGVPYYWIVDPEAQAVKAYVLEAGGYRLALRATGTEPVSPPPFEGLALVPAALFVSPAS